MAMQKQQAADDEHWQNFKSVTQRNEVMLSQQLATDVTFSLPITSGGDKRQTFGAHKYMLVSSSPVFWSMFCGIFKEEADKIDIEDIEFDVFKEMLSFIYTETLNLTGNNVMQVLYATKKYMIGSLTQKCIEFLETHLDPDNVCQLLEQCQLYDETKLTSKCFDIIQSKTKLVLKSHGFKQISKQTLMQILDAKEVSVPEFEIFEACVAWAKNKSEGDTKPDVLRECLGEALYKICIPTMSTEELGKHISPTGILTEKEELLCYRFASKSELPLELPFPNEPRKITGNISTLLLRDCEFCKPSTVSYINNLEYNGHLLNKSQIAVDIVELLLICEKDLNVKVDIFSQINLIAEEHVVSLSTGNLDQVEACENTGEVKFVKIKLENSVLLGPRSFVDYKISYTKMLSSNTAKTLKFVAGSSCAFKNSKQNLKLGARVKECYVNPHGGDFRLNIDTFIPLVGIICRQIINTDKLQTKTCLLCKN